MRQPLAALEVFTVIARLGSLRAAADALGLKPSTVSHQLKTLEERLGTPLMIRTTRSLSLTEAGRALMQGAGPAFDQLSDAVNAARNTGREPRGLLKLALPEFIYQVVLAPVLAGFCARFPEIELELSLTDALSDILGEGLHAGFRLGGRIADDMVAVRLTDPLPLVVAGSRDYLSVHGTPETPRDLLHHHCVRYRFPSSGKIAPWDFTGAEGDYTVDAGGTLTVNSLPVSIDMAMQGLGLVYTFRDYCRAEIAAGDLIPVLQPHMPETPGIHLYYPREYRTMAPLRLLLDHIRSRPQVKLDC